MSLFIFYSDKKGSNFQLFNFFITRLINKLKYTKGIGYLKEKLIYSLRV